MKKSKFIVMLLMVILILVFVNERFQVIDKSIGKSNRNHEVLPMNTSYEGISIFYDTLKEMDYSVKVDAENFLEKEGEGIYIITENKTSTEFKLKDAESWIRQGGKFVYLTDRYQQYHYPDVLDQYKDKAYLYSLGKGRLLIGDIHLITNETLLKDKAGAYYILNVLENLGGNIYFNEYHRFLQGETPSFYKNLPLYIKILLFQLLLVLAGGIIYLRRLGKAKRIMEEIERDENEYLHAAANLYEKGKCMDTIYEAFYHAFQNELKSTCKASICTDECLDLWEKYDLPAKERAMAIFHHGRERKNNDSKETFNIIKDMDQLTQMLRQRREAGWKRLKQRNL